MYEFLKNNIFNIISCLTFSIFFLQLILKSKSIKELVFKNKLIGEISLKNKSCSDTEVNNQIIAPHILKIIEYSLKIEMVKNKEVHELLMKYRIQSVLSELLSDMLETFQKVFELKKEDILYTIFKLILYSHENDFIEFINDFIQAEDVTGNNLLAASKEFHRWEAFKKKGSRNFKEFFEERLSLYYTVFNDVTFISPEKGPDFVNSLISLSSQKEKIDTYDIIALLQKYTTRVFLDSVTYEKQLKTFIKVQINTKINSLFEMCKIYFKESDEVILTYSDKITSKQKDLVTELKAILNN